MQLPLSAWLGMCFLEFLETFPYIFNMSLQHPVMPTSLLFGPPLTDTPVVRQFGSNTFSSTPYFDDRGPHGSAQPITERVNVVTVCLYPLML